MNSKRSEKRVLIVLCCAIFLQARQTNLSLLYFSYPFSFKLCEAAIHIVNLLFAPCEGLDAVLSAYSDAWRHNSVSLAIPYTNISCKHQDPNVVLAPIDWIKAMGAL